MQLIDAIGMDALLSLIHKDGTEQVVSFLSNCLFGFKAKYRFYV